MIPLLEHHQKPRTAGGITDRENFYERENCNDMKISFFDMVLRLSLATEEQNSVFRFNMSNYRRQRIRSHEPIIKLHQRNIAAPYL